MALGTPDLWNDVTVRNDWSRHLNRRQAGIVTEIFKRARASPLCLAFCVSSTDTFELHSTKRPITDILVSHSKQFQTLELETTHAYLSDLFWNALFSLLPESITSLKTMRIMRHASLPTGKITVFEGAVNLRKIKIHVIHPPLRTSSSMVIAHILQLSKH